MSRFIFELSLIALATSACAGDTHRVDVCARGDRADLAAAVKSLELQFEDDAGMAIGAPRSLPVKGAHIDGSAPDGATRVRVTGFDQSGSPIARGDGAIVDGGACVCFAFDSQAPVACEAIGCRVVNESCRFYTPSGDPITSQTLGFGEQADIVSVTTDTYLREDQPTTSHDGPVFEAGPTPTRIALVRFDLSSMPTTAVVESATLKLHICADPACESSNPLEVHSVNEPWTEVATWATRDGTTPWSQAGCGGSCMSAPITTLAGGAPSTSSSTSLPADVVQGWVTTSASNFGIALARASTVGTALHYDSSETTVAGAAPRLDITFHIP